MEKRKISVTTGTRSEFGLLRPVLKEIVNSKKLDLFLIVAGMHLSKKHGHTIDEIKKDGFRIYAKVDMIPKGNSPYNMARELGVGIIKFSEVFRKLKPDINLILGDRDEPLASALAASHMNIPNSHIHGGEVSEGIDEYNRHAITKISSIHFAVTEKSRRRIIRMGENPRRVILTGSPAIDEVVRGKITDKKTLEKKFRINFKDLPILLIQHSVTTQYEASGKQISNTLKAISRLQKPTIAIAPNSDAGNKEIFESLANFSKKHNFLRIYPSLPHCDYLGLLKNCATLVGNSSSGLIEGGYFNIPVINIGSRQKGRERGNNVIDVSDKSANKIFLAISKVLKNKKSKRFKNSFVYGKGKASKKIVKHLESIKLDEYLIRKQNFY